MFESDPSRSKSDNTLTVYYDGACPSCMRDRALYEKLAGENGREVCWFDITGQDETLRKQGIDPRKALQELHVRDGDRAVVSELDAYILLMSKVWLLQPLAWFIGLPVIRPTLAKAYHRMVETRLRNTGRI